MNKEIYCACPYMVERLHIIGIEIWQQRHNQMINNLKENTHKKINNT